MIRPQSCPICKQDVSPAAANPAFPFCSKRCQMVDLSRWCDGKYAIVEALRPEAIPDESPTDPGDEAGYEAE